MESQPVVNIVVDEEELFHREKDVPTIHDINHLIRAGFKQYSAYGIISNKREKYFLKPRYNEGLQHIFLVFEIVNYLKRFIDPKKIQIYQTVKPDIIFTINRKKYAVEVETGKTLRNNKKQLLAKIENLNKIYRDRWFFVVTNRNFTSKYKKLGKTYDKRNVATKILKIIANA